MTRPGTEPKPERQPRRSLQPTSGKPRRGRKWLRRIAIGVGAFLGLLVFIVALVLFTPVGTRAGLEIALPLVNDSLPGSIQYESVDGSFGTGLTIHGLRILTPEGDLVLSVERAHVELALTDLFDQKIRVESAELDDLTFILTDSTGGVGISRAFSAPTPEQPPSEPSPWVIQVDRATIEEGELHQTADAPPAATDIEIGLTFRQGPDGMSWSDVVLTAEAGRLPDLEIPWKRVRLETSGAFVNDALALDRLYLKAGETRLYADGELAFGERLFADMHIHDSVVSLDEVAALTGLPVQGRLALQASAEGADEDFRATVQLSDAAGGDTELTLSAALDLAGEKPDYTLTLDGEDIEPARYTTALKELDAEAEADLSLRAWGEGDPTGTGRARVELIVSDLANVPAPVERLAVRAEVIEGALQATAEMAAGPGGQWTVAATMPDIMGNRLRARVDVSGVERDAWSEVPGLEDLKAEVPRLTASARLTLNPDRPPSVNASVVLNANQIQVPESLGMALTARSVDVAADVRWRGRGLPQADAGIQVVGLQSDLASADEVGVSLTSRQAEGQGTIEASVQIDGGRGPDGIQVDSLNLYARAAGDEGVVPERGQIELAGRGLQMQDMSADLVSVSLEARQREGGFSAEGPLRVSGFEKGEISVGRLDAVASLDVPEGLPMRTSGKLNVRNVARYPTDSLGEIKGSWQLELGDGLPVGEISLDVGDGRIGTVLVESAALDVVLTDQQRGSIELSARTSRADVNLDVRLRMPSGLQGPYIGTIQQLRLADDGAGIVVSPGATVRWDAGTLAVDDFAVRRLSVPDAEIELSGSLNPDTGRLSADLAIPGVRIESWLETLRQVLPMSILPEHEVAGLLNVNAKLGGTLSAPTGRVNVDLVEGRFDTIRDLRLALQAELEPRSIGLDLDAGWGDETRVVVKGDIATRGLKPALGRSSKLDVTLRNLRLGQLKPFLPADLEAQGVVEADINVEGSLDDLKGSVKVSGTQLAVPPLLQEEVMLSADLRPNGVKADVRLGGRDNPVLEACMVAPARVVDALVKGRDLRKLLLETPLAGRVNLRPVRLGDVVQEDVLDQYADVTAWADLNLDGTVGSLDLVGDIHAENVPIGEQRGQLEVLITSADGKAGITAVTEIGGRPLVSASVTLPVLLGKVATMKDPTDLLTRPDTRLIVSTTPIRAAMLRYLSPALAAQLQSLVSNPVLSASIDLKGHPGGPRVSIGAALRDEAGDQAAFFREISVMGVIEAERSRLVVRLLQPDPEGRLFVEATAGVGSALALGRSADWDEVPVTAEIRTPGLKTAQLSSLMPEVFGPSPGVITIDATVDGTVGNPNVQGSIKAAFETLRVSAAGLVQDDVTVEVVFDRNEVVLLPLRLEKDGSSFEVVASLDLNSLQPDDMEIEGKVTMQEFPVLSREDIQATVTGELNLGGTVAVPAVKGAVRADEVVIVPQGGRDLQRSGPPPDVVFVDAADQELAERQLAAKRERGGRPPELNIEVHVPRRGVRIRNDMLDVWAEGDITITSNPQGIVLLGRATVVEGTVNVYGKLFELVEGSQVIFQGTTEINPVLDITARYSLAELDLGGSYTVSEGSAITLVVSGTAQEPRIKLESDVLKSQTEILQVLATGRVLTGPDDDAEDVGTTGAVSNLLLGLVSAQTTRAIEERLPIDTFSVETDASNLSAARITVGKRILPNLVLSYGANLGADEGENINEVELRYEITHNLHLDSEFGDAGAGSVDLVWRWRF